MVGRSVREVGDSAAGMHDDDNDDDGDDTHAITTIHEGREEELAHSLAHSLAHHPYFAYVSLFVLSPLAFCSRMSSSLCWYSAYRLPM